MGFMNSTFPLAVYGLQDAFSGYILYLKLWTTNSDPKLIGRWYMDRLYSTKSNLSCFNNICIQIVIQLKRALNSYIIEIMILFMGFYPLKGHILQSWDSKSVCAVDINSEVCLNSPARKPNVLYSSNPCATDI